MSFVQKTAETKGHFDVVAEDLGHQLQLVAEGVANVIEKLDHELARFDEKIDRGFAERQAMIRNSYN